MKKIFFILGGCLALLFNCGALSLETRWPNNSVEDLLKLSPWTSIHHYEDLNLDGNFIEFGEDCEKDNRWTFMADSLVLLEQGPILCDTMETLANEVQRTKWYVDTGEEGQYLVFDFVLDEVKFLIQGLDEQTLVLLRPSLDSSGIYTHKIILNR